MARTPKSSEVVDSTEEEFDPDFTIPEGEVSVNGGDPEPTSDSSADPDPDFDAFNEALDAVLSDHRSGEASSGEPNEELLPAVVEAYQALEGAKAKARARRIIQETTDQAMEVNNFWLAKVATLVQQKLTTAPKAAKAVREPKAPANPTSAFVDHLLTLRLAYEHADSNRPEGLDADWVSQFNSRLADEQAKLAVSTEVEGAEPTSELVGKAVKLGTLKKSATRRSSGGVRAGAVYSGPPRSIDRHIEQVFADLPVDSFLKIGEIRDGASSEYGDSKPSAGAISGALKSSKFAEKFPNLQLELDANPKGVRKIAS